MLHFRLVSVADLLTKVGINADVEYKIWLRASVALNIPWLGYGSRGFPRNRYRIPQKPEQAQKTEGRLQYAKDISETGGRLRDWRGSGDPAYVGRLRDQMGPQSEGVSDPVVNRVY